MIDEIQVENIALIRKASCVPARGLTVLTGETGAGKTALLSACKLLMGARADKGMVREGASDAVVRGRFFASEAGATGGDEGELVVMRRLTAEGRSRVTVNGDMASVSELGELIAPSIDLCGQHEHQALMRTASHVRMLDAWADAEVGELHEAYAHAFTVAKEAACELERVREARTSSVAQLDDARRLLAQVEDVGIDEAQYDELRAYLGKAENAEALALASNGAYEGLSGEGGALDGLATAIDALTEGARFDASLESYAQSLREASYVLEDVSRDMAGYREDIEYDPAELADAQRRVAAAQGLMRAYGPRFEDVMAARDAAIDLVSLVDDAEERERTAQRMLDEAEAALAAAADALHAVRMAAAPQFASQVSAVMARLEMGSAELLCKVDLLPRDAWTANGPSAVEFLFRPGASMQARPLARIASGGEISRVMLAIHVVMGDRDGASTLVFDEVDAGVGGATAVALASVLADLAHTHQVLVVTHLAQVAVLADTHYVVRKTDGDAPETQLRVVEGEERVAEIARMLSGSATEASLAHARELLG